MKKCDECTFENDDKAEYCRCCGKTFKKQVSSSRPGRTPEARRTPVSQSSVYISASRTENHINKSNKSEQPKPDYLKIFYDNQRDTNSANNPSRERKNFRVSIDDDDFFMAADEHRKSTSTRSESDFDITSLFEALFTDEKNK